jgi:hypothetical protein
MAKTSTFAGIREKCCLCAFFRGNFCVQFLGTQQYRGLLIPFIRFDVGIAYNYYSFTKSVEKSYMFSKQVVTIARATQL